MMQRLEEFSNGTYSPYGIAIVVDSTGQYAIDLGSSPQVLTYTANGELETVTVTDREGNSFRQTLTYTNGKVTQISAWVKV